MADAGSGSTDLSAELAAQLLGLKSARRIQQLHEEGWIKKNGRDRYPLTSVVQGYVAFLNDRNQALQQNTAANRKAEAAATATELKTAREARELISTVEAAETVEQITGMLLAALEGLPARLTRNTRERSRFKKVCDAERDRLAAEFAKVASALETGGDADESEGEAVA